ncbi:MAG: glycosyltransferase family 2 protein [Deltaproteobacteria bacterium]|nr:glycosyltransferase family 2 protein [Deltaproteobacteria bacterium]
MSPEKLSVCVITYNEEGNIRDCLESVKWAHEIVVVDSFSEDKTADICKEYTDKVLQRKWPGYVEQKNFIIQQAKGDWILSLDADERVSPELQEDINAVLQGQMDNFDGFYFPRHSFYLGRWINHGGWYPDYKLRLYKQKKGKWAGQYLHEKVMVSGGVGYLSGELIHYVYKNIADQLKTVDNFSTISAQELHKAGKKFRLWLPLFRPWFRFLEMYVIKRGVLDGFPGFVIAVVSSYYVFLKYAKLWELQRGT